MAKLAVQLGVDNKLGREDVEALFIAGMLHDCGKCDIKVEILSKSSQLSAEERKRIRGHPRLGFIALSGSRLRMIRRIIIGHHEYQSSPYPRSGEDRRGGPSRRGSERRGGDSHLVFLIQIIAIADVFDALVSRRAYKVPLSLVEVRKILKEHFTGNKKLVRQVMRLAKY